MLLLDHVCRGWGHETLIAIPTKFLNKGLNASAVLIASLLLPAVLVLTVFPTPLYDTRELIAWGRQFPLLTPDHPPMMAWVGGSADLVFGSSGLATILVAQGLIALGLVFFYRALRLLVTRERAALFAFLYGTSFYVVFGSLSFALNADLLQLTSWPAVVFYALRALRAGRLSDWIALAVWSAVAFLTKYNAAVLIVGLAIAALVEPDYRLALSRPGFYVAVIVGGLLICPHAIVALQHPGALTYGLDHFHPDNSFGTRLKGISEWMLGFIVCSTPGSIALLLGFWRGSFVLRAPAAVEALKASRFLAVANVAMQLILLGVILFGGVEYLFRFSPPYLMMAALALGPWIDWRGDGERWFARYVVPAIAALNLSILVVLLVVYGGFASHSGLQEPTGAGARAILQDWHKTYSCGPGYFFGVRQRVYGIGIEAGRDVTPLALEDIRGALWFDPDKLRRKGAVFVDTKRSNTSWVAVYEPNFVLSDDRSVSLPLLRTHKPGAQFTYSYTFLAPQGC